MSTATKTAQYVASATASGREGRADVRRPPRRRARRTARARWKWCGHRSRQLFAAGYAACFASALGVVARQRKVDDFDAAVTAESASAATAERARPRGGAARELPEGSDEALGRELVEVAHQVCLYSNAMRGDIPVELVVE